MLSGFNGLGRYFGQTEEAAGDTTLADFTATALTSLPDSIRWYWVKQLTKIVEIYNEAVLDPKIGALHSTIKLQKILGLLSFLITKTEEQNNSALDPTLDKLRSSYRQAAGTAFKIAEANKTLVSLFKHMQFLLQNIHKAAAEGERSSVYGQYQLPFSGIIDFLGESQDSFKVWNFTNLEDALKAVEDVDGLAEIPPETYEVSGTGATKLSGLGAAWVAPVVAGAIVLTLLVAVIYEVRQLLEDLRSNVEDTRKAVQEETSGGIKDLEEAKAKLIEQGADPEAINKIDSAIESFKTIDQIIADMKTGWDIGKLAIVGGLLVGGVVAYKVVLSYSKK